ncbi:MAG: hypothetical protein K5990_04560 [Oscillospiraceae bacterium]|nr:hypothetical protein [Oscillospiraceae bacterium]
MLKVLLKKQLSEVFRNYFYNPKTNRMRSKWAVAGWFVFFAVVMVGVLGGMFTALSLTLCPALAAAELGWLYFLLLGGVAVVLGAFGSVFNTYSGLYLAKDNDLLLSMPIPLRTILAARLTNVYLLGTLYAATAMIPALAVYWLTAGPTAANVVGGLLLFLLVSLIVLLLSCLLGWVVAQVSVRLKNRSGLTVLLALVFIGLYYFVYFKAADLIRDMLQNAAVYGAQIRGAARGLYLFGRVGEGDFAAAAPVCAVLAALAALVWLLLRRSFLRLATSHERVGDRRGAEKTAQQRSPFAALLGKELRRFTASPNYMLNCGLSVLLLPLGGVALLLYGRELGALLETVFSAFPDAGAVLFCAAICLLASMNDMAAPSVSLEGKSLWIPQSLPLEPKTVLRAKAAAQLLLSGPTALLCGLCAAAVLPGSLGVRLLLCLTVALYTVFYALACAAVGVRLPLLTWSSELIPIKQSGAVTLALLGSWLLCAVLGGVYMLLGYQIGAAAYLLIWSALFAGASALLLRWLDTKGAATLAAL